MGGRESRRWGQHGGWEERGGWAVWREEGGKTEAGTEDKEGGRMDGPEKGD